MLNLYIEDTMMVFINYIGLIFELESYLILYMANILHEERFWQS